MASHGQTHTSGTDPFAETDDQQALRQLARDVAERALLPNARHWDETEEFPQASWDALRQAELLGITTDERYGGGGLGDIEAAIVLEELGRVDVSSAILAQLMFNGPPRAIQPSIVAVRCASTSAAVAWSRTSTVPAFVSSVRSLIGRTSRS